MMRSLLRITLTGSLALAACSGDDGGDDDDGPITGVCQNVTGSEEQDGLSIRRPTANVAGCTSVEGSSADVRVCQEKTPDLSCLGTMTPLGTSVDVTFTGCVSSFGLEAQSDGLVVTILRERDGNQATDPGYRYSGTAVMGAGAEKTPGAFVGQVVSENVGTETCLDGGRFAIENVPTETQLIVRVTDQNQDGAGRQYVDTYQYNVVLRNDDVRSGASETDPLVSDPIGTCTSTGTAPCFVVDEVNTVFETTFTTIALTAGVSNIEGDDDLYDGVGQGHIAGEIQDCTSSDTMKNAIVAVSKDVRKLAYFNVDFPPAVANLEDPKVDQSRSRTNADGLYAAIAVDTQDGGEAVTIGAAITEDVCGADGQCQCNADGTANAADTGDGPTVRVLGTRQIFVYPDSITILTFDEALYSAP